MATREYEWQIERWRIEDVRHEKSGAAVPIYLDKKGRDGNANTFVGILPGCPIRRNKALEDTRRELWKDLDEACNLKFQDTIQIVTLHSDHWSGRYAEKGAPYVGFEFSRHKLARRKDGELIEERDLNGTFWNRFHLKDRAVLIPYSEAAWTALDTLQAQIIQAHRNLYQLMQLAKDAPLGFAHILQSLTTPGFLLLPVSAETATMAALLAENGVSQ